MRFFCCLESPFKLSLVTFSSQLTLIQNFPKEGEPTVCFYSDNRHSRTARGFGFLKSTCSRIILPTRTSAVTTKVNLLAAVGCSVCSFGAGSPRVCCETECLGSLLPHSSHVLISQYFMQFLKALVLGQSPWENPIHLIYSLYYSRVRT